MKNLKLTNLQASQMADAAERFSDDKGLLGYACARNARKLTEASLEYVRIRNAALEELGEEVVDGAGAKTGMRIGPDCDGWPKFRERMEPFDAIKCEVEVMTVPASEVIGKISGRDAMSIEWMIEDDER